VEVELMVPERVVEGEGVLGAGEALDGDQGVPVVRAHVCGAAGHVCDLLQRLFLFFTHCSRKKSTRYVRNFGIRKRETRYGGCVETRVL
jgi:hypothetical protein